MKLGLIQMGIAGGRRLEPFYCVPRPHQQFLAPIVPVNFRTRTVL